MGQILNIVTRLSEISVSSQWELVITWHLFTRLKGRSVMLNSRIYFLKITEECLIQNLTELKTCHYTDEPIRTQNK